MDAQPVHPGIDLQMQPGMAACLTAGMLRRPDPFGREHCERDLGGRGFRHDSVRHGPQYQDWSTYPGAPQLQRLSPARHSEPARPGLKSHSGNRHRAMTVAIGLDDRHDLGVAAGQLAHIRPDRPQIDLNPCSLAGGHIHAESIRTPAATDNAACRYNPAQS